MRTLFERRGSEESVTEIRTGEPLAKFEEKRAEWYGTTEVVPWRLLQSPRNFARGSGTFFLLLLARFGRFEGANK